MTTYTYDHIHLRSQDPMATAQYFNKMFDAKIVESVQSDGQPRIDIDVNGLMIFIAKADEIVPAGLRSRPFVKGGLGDLSPGHVQQVLEQPAVPAVPSAKWTDIRVQYVPNPGKQRTDD